MVDFIDIMRVKLDIPSDWEIYECGWTDLEGLSKLVYILGEGNYKFVSGSQSHKGVHFSVFYSPEAKRNVEKYLENEGSFVFPEKLPNPWGDMRKVNG